MANVNQSCNAIFLMIKFTKISILSLSKRSHYVIVTSYNKFLKNMVNIILMKRLQFLQSTSQKRHFLKTTLYKNKFNKSVKKCANFLKTILTKRTQHNLAASGSTEKFVLVLLSTHILLVFFNLFSFLVCFFFVPFYLFTLNWYHTDRKLFFFFRICSIAKILIDLFVKSYYFYFLISI